jgi:hypothetical protein
MRGAPKEQQQLLLVAVAVPNVGLSIGRSDTLQCRGTRGKLRRKRFLFTRREDPLLLEGGCLTSEEQVVIFPRMMRTFTQMI